jgi:hypothetical protein
MKLSEIVTLLELEHINKGAMDEDTVIENGYVCDLLSQVLAGAKPGSIWITIQSHMNIIGVASMAGIKAIIVCEGHNVPEDVISKADEEGIALFKSSMNAFQISGKLYESGIR